MKKRNLKLNLKKEVISRLEMKNILGGNLPGSHYPPDTETYVAICTWTVGNCHPAPVPTCNSGCPTYPGANTCPCDNTVYCTIPDKTIPC